MNEDKTYPAAMTIGELLSTLCGEGLGAGTVLRSRDGEDYSLQQACSWRGSYVEPALVMVRGHGSLDASIFERYLETLLSETFEGWKGGEFTFSRNQHVYVVNGPSSTGTPEEYFPEMPDAWNLNVGLHLSVEDGNPVLEFVPLYF